MPWAKRIRHCLNLICYYYYILLILFDICREHSITNAKASVMLYDNDRKQWQHSGGTPGLSRVNIYHHPVNNTFRIVGRKLDDHAVSGKMYKVIM